MKITAEELAMQIKVLLSDEFIAKINVKGSEIIMAFFNGQNFLVNVVEG